MKKSVKDDNVILRMEKTEEERNIFGKYNKVVIIGQVFKEITTQEINSKVFYKTIIKVLRNSDKKDYIPVLIPKELFKEEMEEKWIVIAGEIRTYIKNHVKTTFLYVRQLEIFNDEADLSEPKDTNIAYLKGYLCQKPYYKILKREGKNDVEIVGFCIAVHRNYGKGNQIKTDYIQCVAWRRNDVEQIKKIEMGHMLKIYGRFQSRFFFKATSEINVTQVGEVSITEIC